MAQNFSFVLLLLCVIVHVLLVKCQAPLSPALYVFSDSLNDSGNNNFLRTVVKANYAPYGIDFPSQIPTGRFTNGRTRVDFIAQLLALPLVPAYLSLSPTERQKITTGVNYASGAAGILPDTGSATGDVLSFDKQIDNHQVILRNLRPIFGSISAFRNYLSKSIFWVSIGRNDYFAYNQRTNSTKNYTPERFADLLIRNIRSRLIRLYVLGARKFVMTNVGRIGCTPAILNTTNPRSNTPCNEDVNNLVMLYNTRLPDMITNLERILPGSTFVRGDIYSMNKTSAQAGYTVQQIPCCQVSGTTGLCLPGSTPCQDRATSIFWDASHPTETIYNSGANDCFSGSSSCTPINVQQLALK